MKRIILCSSIVVSMCFAGCGKDENKEKGNEAAKPAGDKSSGEAAATPAPLSIEEYGLTITAPAGAKATKSLVADRVVVKAANDFKVNIRLAEENDAKTLADAVSKMEMYKPLNLVKAEVEGGWDMTFERKVASGSSFGVDVARTIDGKSYRCGVDIAPSKELQESAFAACKTLTK